MEIENEKKEILKDLVKSKEEVLQKLKSLVEKSKKIILIEEITGKVIIIIKEGLSLQNKITALLIGKYFAYELGITKSQYIQFDEIKKEIGASSRALSYPLGILLRENIIEKSKDGYAIKYYQIENCVDNILQSKEAVKIKRTRTDTKKEKIEVKTKPRILDKEGIKKLVKKLGISEDDLSYIFDFEENDLNIIAPIEGSNEGERQLKATLLYLTAYSYCFNSEEISSIELREKIEDLGIGSLVNFSTNLKNFRKFIIHKTKKRGSIKTSYKITQPGKERGAEIIKEILENIKGS